MTERDKHDLERVLAHLLEFAVIVRHDGVSWTDCEQAYSILLDIIALLTVITGADTDSIKKHLTELVAREEGDCGAGT